LWNHISKIKSIASFVAGIVVEVSSVIKDESLPLIKLIAHFLQVE